MPEYTPTIGETRLEKIRLIKDATKELKEHGLVDLTDFINKHSREGFKHPGFVRSVAYKMEEQGISEVIPQKEWTEFYVKLIPWQKRKPYLNALLLSIISSLFSLLVGIAVGLTVLIVKDTDQKKIDRTQNTVLQNLRDSVINIQYYLKNQKH